MTREEELASLIDRFEVGVKQADMIVVQLREAVGTLGMLVMAIRALAKKSDFNYKTGRSPDA